MAIVFGPSSPNFLSSNLYLLGLGTLFNGKHHAPRGTSWWARGQAAGPGRLRTPSKSSRPVRLPRLAARNPVLPAPRSRAELTTLPLPRRGARDARAALPRSRFVQPDRSIGAPCEYTESPAHARACAPGCRSLRDPEPGLRRRRAGASQACRAHGQDQGVSPGLRVSGAWLHSTLARHPVVCRHRAPRTADGSVLPRINEPPGRGPPARAGGVACCNPRPFFWQPCLESLAQRRARLTSPRVPAARTSARAE